MHPMRKQTLFHVFAFSINPNEELNWHIPSGPTVFVDNDLCIKAL